MGNQHTSESSSDVRKTRFTILKEQQCSLNMQIRLAMELHNAQVQEELQKELMDTIEQIEHFTCQPS